MSDLEPRRLVDDDAEGEALRVDLERASEHRIDYDVAAGVAVFEASLAGAPPPALEATVSSGTAGGAAGGKLLLVVVGLAAAVGVGAVIASGGTDEPAPVVAEQEAPVEPADARPAIVPEPPTQPDAVPALSPAPAVEPESNPEFPPEPALEPDGRAPVQPTPVPRRPSKPRANPSDEAPKSPAVDRLKAEMAATDEARRALAGNPGKALKLAREADRTYADGLFAEQRAGIAALALFGLGKGDQAATAAERYLRKYPKGTYADKVRARLDEKP